jgi:glycosyltransferase involved in cell wall biosynthesis
MWGAAWPAFRAGAVLGGWTGRPVQWAAVSDAAARPVRRALRERDVLVIPNAVDTAYWAPRSPTRHRSGVTIVAVGRMHRRKRPLHLVSVLEQARALVPGTTPLRAVVVGDGPQHAVFRREVAARGMQSWVEAPGDLSHDQIRAIYDDAELFVAPATLESFGIAALEARTAGLVVLAREHTGVGSFVDHGVDGMLAASDAQMATQLAHLCTDHVTRARMAAHNRATLPALDWGNVLHRNEHAYAAAGAVEHACLCAPVA